jgi:hypothetical protein
MYFSRRIQRNRNKEERQEEASKGENKVKDGRKERKGKRNS